MVGADQSNQTVNSLQDTSFSSGELEFEDNLIQFLQSVGGTRQWKYRPEIKTTAQLWHNFRAILESNNKDRLKGTPLSDQEFSQIQAQIKELDTPYKAGQFLYGTNGISQVALTRDDGTEAYLTVFDQDSIGAGNTVYEIVNQIERPYVVPGMKDRRFDTTLLINGLPIIQIEEKAAGHDPREALNQMRQYIYEKQYSDIFSTLQILIGLTPTDALYMARPQDAEHFNTDFSFGWLNETTNERITDYRDFCNRVLSIPAAHQLATSYMILDGTRNKQAIKVMRPYQVFATRNVIEKLRTHRFGIDDSRLGYIWHTTGSGKTITSFKTAWLASRLPNVDKVVFLVDRVALTNQTVEEYQAYDPENTDDSAGGVVTDSANRWQLERKLKTKGKGIIVTSTQKMHAMCMTKDKDSNKKQQRNSIDAIKQKNIVFIVDEAHRSTDGDMLADIRTTLPNAAWIGYTGTPSFEKTPGSRTTQDIFGPMLHAYTIRDAIADHNVLGFKVDFETTLSRQSLIEDYLPKFFKQRNPDWSDEQINKRVNNLTDADMDDMLSPSVYDNNPEHIRLVVKDILEKWDKRSAARRYNAMLTTHVAGNASSIGMAIEFYKEFARQNALLPENKRIKVGITYSENQSNDDHQYGQNSFLDTVLADYNAMFGTSFQRVSLKEYTADLAARLNRTISHNKSDWLDLVIVVDRLLTGFDAPQLNTLYVDRTLKGAQLIQAYSRTNRIFDMKTKPFGHVVSYRWPGNSEKLMKQALSTYANPDSALKQGELEIDDPEDPGCILAVPYKVVVEKIRETIDQISSITDGFTAIPKTVDEAKETLQLIYQYGNNLAQAKQDEAFPDDASEFLTEVTLDSQSESWIMDTLRRSCLGVIHDHVGTDGEDDDLDLKFASEVERVTRILVDYDYLEKLIANMLNALHEQDQEQAEHYAAQIQEQTDRMEDRKYAEQIAGFTRDALAGHLGDDGITYPVDQDAVKHIVLDHADGSMRREVFAFKQRWGLQDIKDSHLVNEILERHVVGQSDLDVNHELTEIQKQAQANYATDATDPEVRGLSRIVYRRKLGEALVKFADVIRRKY